jgi:type I restriction enzyme M protein
MAKQTGRAVRAAAGGANPSGPWLQRALDDGKATLQFAGTRQTITYVAVGHTESYDDPEEWVRADFWAELIYRLNYPEIRIAIEIPVPDRTPGDYADLVVCKDDERTDPFAVIETKSDGINEAEFDQAVEQAAGNGSGDKFRADYVGVVAGSQRRFLDLAHFGTRERVKNAVADLPPEYKDPAAFRFLKGTDPGDPNELMPATKERLIATLVKCHNTLWGGGKMAPPQAFSELCKLLFVKIADEKQARKPGEPYEVQVKTGETAAGLAARIGALYKAHQRNEPDIFTSDIAIAPETLKILVETIQSTSFAATDLDVKGVAFELFMDSFFKGGFGQYFTPREVVRFAVDLLDVQPTDWVLDPSCGSGGFLLHALEIVLGKANAYHPTDRVEHYKLWNDFANKRLFGVEINEEIARITKMNMILHGDGHTNIVRQDALDRAAVLKENRSIRAGEFDLVLTNVPFGASIKLDEHPYLRTYPWLGNKPVTTKHKGVVNRPRKSQKSEIIFLERIGEFLRPGTGRAAIILPDGILTNASTRYVREFLLDQFAILAVVSLPVETFTHYGANVKASIVFVRKLGAGEAPDPDAPVFLAEAQSVGYDATGRPAHDQLPDILEAYRAFQADAAPFLVEVPVLATEMVIDAQAEGTNDEGTPDDE